MTPVERALPFALLYEGMNEDQLVTSEPQLPLSEMIELYERLQKWQGVRHVAQITASTPDPHRIGLLFDKGWRLYTDRDAAAQLFQIIGTEIVMGFSRYRDATTRVLQFFRHVNGTYFPIPAGKALDEVRPILDLVRLSNP